MTVLTILQQPNPVLKMQASPIAMFDESLEALTQDMIETLIANNLLGLAATQVGVLQNVIVINGAVATSDKVNPEPYPVVMVNPKIKHLGTNKKNKSIGKVWNFEGCASIPNTMYQVERTIKIDVEFQNVHGNNVGLQLNGALSFRVQHECDHLKGVMLNDAGKYRQMQIVK